MDGGRRLPGSLRVWFAPRPDEAVNLPADSTLAGRRSRLGFGRSGFRIGNRTVVIRRGLGSLSVILLLGATGALGWLSGGHHATMMATQGSLSDIAARVVGFPIRSVDISGVKELHKDEILEASGLSPSGSLLFVNIADVRARLKTLPLVAEATVRKLYPDRINIAIVEREPFALWQQDGTISVVSADGTVIDGLVDQRYLKLPHVVGPGARLRVKEYASILEGVPELRSQIRAGVLVSERRWTLKLSNGVDVKLPEAAPVEALRQLVRLDKESQVLSKDIIAVDLRVAGRVVFRLTEEAAATRRDYFEKTLPKIRGRA
jgi:cell division protein FtsQ